MYIHRFSFLTIAVLSSMISGLGAAAADNVLSCKSSDRYHDSLNAFETCHRALQDKNLAKSDRAELLLARAEAAYFLSQFGRALMDLDEALSLDPDLDEAYLRRAWTKMQVDLYPDALEDITNVLSREPDNADALFALGFFYADTNEWQTKAMPAFKQVLELNPNHYLARFNLVNIYKDYYGTYEDAISEYDKILQASDEELQKVRIFYSQGYSHFDFRGDVRLERAAAVMQLERYPEVLAELSSLALAYPQVGDVFAVRAQLYNRLRKFNEAHADARLAIELEPYGFAQMESLVEALVGLGNHSQAISNADKFVSGPLAASIRGRILFWRGYANKALGNREEALQDFETSISYDQSSLPRLLTQLVQNKYYKGEVTDTYNERARNGLQACIIDPECGR